MPDAPSGQKPAEKRSFWATLPGVMTAVGGVIGAIAALITALAAAGVFARPAAPTPSPSPTVTVTAVAAATAAEMAALPANTLAPPSPTEPASLPAPTSAPALLSTPAGAPAAGDLLLADDFEDPASGWLASVTDEDEKGYDQGAYRIAVYGVDLAVWGYPEPENDFADFVIEVDAHRVDGPDENEYGIIARYQPDDSFYLFSVKSTGYVSIQKHIGDDWEYLVEWTESAAVRQGGEINRLRVTCQGARLRFFVNGQAVAEADDADFRSGNIGLLASAGEATGVVAAFDNLRVRALEAP